MTLYRQLLLATLITLICLCTGLWLGDHKRTRDFLADQLASHAQDTATSLGLSLSTLTKGTDVPAMEAMISALFDQGYYTKIQFRDIHGVTVIDRHGTIQVEGVPAWFVRLTPLPMPQAEALVMQGWQQTGTIIVQSHPGYAYRTLWNSALATAWWFAGATLAVALCGSLALHRLLKPLVAVEEQALALSERRFHVQDVLPRTRELRRVVLAMNRMTERIREMFHEQAAIAENLRQRAYQDSLTALGNRRFLEAQAATQLESQTDGSKGALLLLQIQSLKSLNQEQGYTAGDQCIIDAATSLRRACAQLPEAILARLGGGDLAALLPNTDQSTANRIASQVLEELNQPGEAGDSSQRPGIVACGGVIYSQGMSFGDLLAKADSALNTARYREENKAIFVTDEEPGQERATTGKAGWKTLLEQVLTERTIYLYTQPTVYREDRRRIFHHEILTRVANVEGNHVPAIRFLPIAEQLDLMPALDRVILEHIFALPPDLLLPRRLAVNLSPLSLADPEFVTWILEQLRYCATSGRLLSFEFPEFRAIRHLHLIKSFAEAIQAMGHAVGIDHFGQGMTHYGYLRSLLPNYVKIDRAITNELLSEATDSHFFVSSLCTVAHSLDISVIVEGIETEKQWQTVASLPIDAVQGYYIRRPAPLNEEDND